jgi:hypothetical protein
MLGVVDFEASHNLPRRMYGRYARIRRKCVDPEHHEHHEMNNKCIWHAMFERNLTQHAPSALFYKSNGSLDVTHVLASSSGVDEAFIE